MPKIKYWLGWLLRPLCWSPEFWCASCGSGANAMCSTRVRSLLTLVEHKTASQRRMQPSWRLEGAQMIMQLLLVVLCVGWVVLAMVFGILPFAPLIVGAMEALPGLALTSMLTDWTASKLGQRVECETECCAKFHGEIRPYFQCSNLDWVVQSKDARFYGMLGCWSGRRCIGTWDGTCSATTLASCWGRSLRRLGPSSDEFLWFHLWPHEELFRAVLEPFLPRRGCPIYCNSKFPFKRWSSSSSLSEKNILYIFI